MRELNPQDWSLLPIENLTPTMIQNHYRELLRIRVNELLTETLDEMAQERAKIVVQELLKEELASMLL